MAKRVTVGAVGEAPSILRLAACLWTRLSNSGTARMVAVGVVICAMSVTARAVGQTPTLAAGAGADRPVFQMPFACGEAWYATFDPVHKALRWNAAPSDGNADAGRAVVAAAAGVARVGQQPGGWGNFVVIDHGNGWRTRYAHLRRAGRVTGSVTQGQVIGYVGTSGRAATAELDWQQIHAHVAQVRLYVNGAAVTPDASHASTNQCPVVRPDHDGDGHPT